MQIQLNDEGSHATRKDVVQKVRSDARENEETRCKSSNDVRGEHLYVQVSSFDRDLHNKHYKWSLCSIDKLKSNCSLLIKYLLVNSFLVCCQKKLHFMLVKFCRSAFQHLSTNANTFLYGVGEKNREQKLVEEHSHKPLHKSLTINESFILFMLLHWKTATATNPAVETNFYIKLYKILLNSFYEDFNNKTNCHHLCRYQREKQQENRNHQHSINSFCDLSTKSRTRQLSFLIKDTSGIEHFRQHQCHKCLLCFIVSMLDLVYGFLIIQNRVTCREEIDGSNRGQHRDNQYVKHYILLQLLAHNQTIEYERVAWLRQRHDEMKFQLSDDKSCHEIENGISMLATTSNHKLKATANKNDNDTCHESEKFSNCYQQFHRAFRSNDSVKSHLNAILFLIILCIPLLTAASSVHNLKYSTNVVKTKYGPLRGIILRSTPTVEGYFGVPYGEFLFD